VCVRACVCVCEREGERGGITLTRRVQGLQSQVKWPFLLG